jgi:hypothetical protein
MHIYSLYELSTKSTSEKTGKLVEYPYPKGTALERLIYTAPPANKTDYAIKIDALMLSAYSV